MNRVLSVPVVGPCVGLVAQALLALVVASPVTTGCAGPQVDAAPPIAQLDGTSLAIRRAVVRASEAAASSDAVVVRARYNPAHCDCPAWELQLWGRWTRVALTPARDAGAWVDPFATTAFAEGDQRAVIGLRAVDAPVVAGGWTYATYQFADLQPAAEP